MRSTGEVVCILREGDNVGGKPVKVFNVLKAVAASQGQTRSFNGAGALVVHVKYGDDTSAIVQFNIP